MTNIKKLIAQKAAEEIKATGSYLTINLGIGIPTLISKYLEQEEYFLHTENGLLGVANIEDESIDPLLVNAGKMPVREAVGASYFNSAESFGMIRGGHIDIAVLGGLQIDSYGQVANWAIPGRDIIGVGGAMDLLEGAKKTIITTTHVSKNGTPKLVEKCLFPITSQRKVDVIVTEMAVFNWKGEFFELVDLVGDTTLEMVKNNTFMSYVVNEKVLKEDI
ncbi:CoA-transferase [Oceanobacillus sp. FSL K6-2867]|uniref:CoA-transferase n=1 Tax=Oceanobacillus sp. FSL K6-2867 TaxID=2954748 RepID=UPI0030DC72C9